MGLQVPKEIPGLRVLPVRLVLREQPVLQA